MTPSTPGTLYGVGIGPGDPELITVKGKRIVESVPVVFLPVSGERERSFAGTIAQALVRPEAQEVIVLPYPMTRDRDRVQEAARLNAGRIAQTLLEGRDAAFLTEGDALLYSTFVHTLAAMRALHPALPVVVVPGVTSFAAAAAATLTPLAGRDERIAILPATYEGDELTETLRRFDTVVLMKVSGAVDRVLDALAATGRTADALFVERCGRPEEAIVRDVTELRGRTCDYFSLVIVRRQNP